MRRYNNCNISEKVKKELDEMLDLTRNNETFVVLDLETTGFSPLKGGRIIEVGAVKINDGKVVDKFETLINPELSIPKKIEKITGINNRMVIDAPYYQNVLPLLYDFIGTHPIVGHNVKFDWDTFLLYYFETIGLYPSNKSIDTMVFAKSILPAQRGDKMNLGDVCSRCNVSLEGAHRAINDAEATAQIFLIGKKIIDKFHKPKLEQESLFNIFGSASMNNSMIEHQKIKAINYWEKEFSNRKLKRLYVDLEKSKVFYDFIVGSWQIKESPIKVDFSVIEKDVLDRLKSKQNYMYHILKSSIDQNKNNLKLKVI